MRFVWCILSGNKDAFIRLPGNLKGISPSYLKEDREKYSKEVKISDTVWNKSGFKESWNVTDIEDYGTDTSNLILPKSILNY